MPSFYIVRGIALIQVLLITAIFSTLLLIMVSNVKQHQGVAYQILEKAEKQLILYSAMNELSFQLLTQSWLGEGSGEQKVGWNFYGKPFEFESTHKLAASFLVEEPGYKIQAKIQDINGLIDVRFPGEEMQKLLVAKGVAPEKVVHTIQSIESSQRKTSLKNLSFSSPGLYFQHVSELKSLPVWEAGVMPEVDAYLRAQGDNFNYLTAPEKLLATLLPKAQFDILHSWREQNTYTLHRAEQFLGPLVLEGPYFPGNELIITLSIDNQEISSQVLLSSRSSTPIIIRYQKRGRSRL